MKFGVYTVSTPEYDYESATKLIKDMGYDGVEWRVAAAPAPDASDSYALRYWNANNSTIDKNHIQEDTLRAKKASDAAGLEIFGLAPDLPLEENEKFAEIVKAAAAIGVKQVRYGLISFDPEKTGMDYTTHCEYLRTKMRELEPVLKANNVKLVIEMHHGTLTPSASAAYRVLDGFDPQYYGLIYDIGNMVFEGYEDPVKSFQLLGDYITHVHLKNGILEQDGVDALGAVTWKNTWVPLKKGQANLQKLFDAMVKAGYDGTVSLEDFSNEETTEEKLRNNLEYMHMLLERAKGK